MAFDALHELRVGGNQVDQLSEAQVGVLSELSPAEVATLNSIKSRIDAVSGDVEGHVLIFAGVGIF